MGGENLPSHPELLDELADQFVAHDFELKFLIRAITATQAYGLTSAIERPEPTPPDLFSAMPVRGLSAGQLFSSLAQATGFRDGPDHYAMGDGGARAGSSSSSPTATRSRPRPRPRSSRPSR